MNQKHVIIPIFIPHKGCPFDCIYCNQKIISGQIEEMTEEKMRFIIEEHLMSISEGTFIEIGFFGGSFTGIEKDHQVKFLIIANEYIDEGKVSEIRLSTRPDYINEEILDILKKFRVNTIELGVQSLDNEVLRRSIRGHLADHVFKSVKLIKEYGFKLGIQTMIGLPGDSREKDLYTAGQVIELAPSIVRIYPTLVIKGTELELLFRRGDYNALSLNDAVDVCAELLGLYQKNNIKVIRLGLQTTETINTGMDVVAGPFHPAFRQLVESKLYLKKIEDCLSDRDIKDKKSLTVFTRSKNVSNVTGHKRENIEYIKQKYRFKLIKVIIDEKIEDEIRIQMD